MRALDGVGRVLAGLTADEAGATVIEYALIAFIVSIGIGFLLPEAGLTLHEILGAAQAGLDRGGIEGQAG